jgi:DNA-binding NarL/FixJ family response regulator
MDGGTVRTLIQLGDFMQILCAENSPVTFAGISILLEVEGYENVTLAANYSQIKEKLSSKPFDLLITELRFEDAELLDVAEEIHAQWPSLKILVYTHYDNPTYLARASANRLFDFVLKSSNASKLLRSVAESKTGGVPGESLLSMSTQFLTSLAQPVNPNTAHLTKRENQILTHLALGLSNKEISLVLSISLETVKEHVQNVLRKLKANDRTEAAVWALRKGVPTLNLV